MRKSSFKLFKKKYIYLFFCLILFLVSGIISAAKVKNLSWKNALNTAGVTKSSELPAQKESKPDENFDMKVHFLDVGKADCIYINFKGHNILIDAADKEPRAVVTEYLKRQDVSDFDMVFISHPHRDHIGQMPQVIGEFEVKKFFEPEMPKNLIPTGVTYERMLKALERKKVDAKALKAGEKFEVGDLKIDVFGPVKEGNNVNNNSIVLKMTYSDISFLFVGDAEKEEEADILAAGYDVKADVLKVGHHGSKTSSSEAFLKKVRPKHAVISVGPDKSNLPKEEIIKRLGKYCGNTYRTDLAGDIVVSTNGKEIKVQTEKA